MTRKVSDFMHRGATSRPPEASLTDLAKVMRSSDVGAIPIVEKGKVLGIVTDRDVTVKGLAAGKDYQTLTAKDIMSRNVACCKETDTAQSAAELMRARKIRRLPVLNQNNVLTGMVSLGDISHILPDAQSGQLIKAVAEHHA